MVGMTGPGSFDERDPVLESPFSRSLPYLSYEHDDDGLRSPGQIPSVYSPMPGCVGGYIDVHSKRHTKPRREDYALRISEEDELKMEQKGQLETSVDDYDDQIVGRME